MIGLYGIGLGASSQYWRPVVANRIATISRAQPQATDRPVAPISAAPTVGRDQPSIVRLSGIQYQPGTDPAKLSVRDRIQHLSPEELEAEIAKSKSAQKVMAEGVCQTCKKRKYQDCSDDPGVSFKTPANVVPELAASAVQGHEQKHVVREQAEARREGREVVSQSLTTLTGLKSGRFYGAGSSGLLALPMAPQPRPMAGCHGTRPLQRLPGKAAYGV